MNSYQMTIERAITMRVIVDVYGETEEEAKINALGGDTSCEEELERIEQKNVSVISVDGVESCD